MVLYKEEVKQMKAVIKLDVPDFQIGQPVTVYFRDTMQKKGYCEPDREIPIRPDTEGDRSWFFVCGECHGEIGNRDSYCKHCGQKVLWDSF